MLYFHKDTLTEVEKYVRYVSQKRVKNVFGRKRKNEYEDDYEDETTAWLEGAVMGAWASVFICDWLDKEDAEDED